MLSRRVQGKYLNHFTDVSQPTEEELQDGDPTERAGLYEGDIDMAYHEVKRRSFFSLFKQNEGSAMYSYPSGSAPQHDQWKTAPDQIEERHQTTGMLTDMAIFYSFQIDFKII